MTNKTTSISGDKQDWISLATARKYLSYDPETGIITYALPVHKYDGRVLEAGTEAGCINKEGYRQISLNGRQYLSHRLAWFLHYGEWPKQYLDHVDGIRTNNSISNLKDVSHQENMNNKDASRKALNKRYPGVSYDAKEKLFKAVAEYGDKKEVVGLFDDPKLAYMARVDRIEEMREEADREKDEFYHRIGAYDL